jgi:hypothetical protein
MMCGYLYQWIDNEWESTMSDHSGVTVTSSVS